MDSTDIDTELLRPAGTVTGTKAKRALLQTTIAMTTICGGRAAEADVSRAHQLQSRAQRKG